MLNKSNSAEWLAGWTAAVQAVWGAEECYRPVDVIAHHLRIQSELPVKVRNTPWQHGYVAALSAAVGAL